MGAVVIIDDLLEEREILKKNIELYSGVDVETFSEYNSCLDYVEERKKTKLFLVKNGLMTSESKEALNKKIKTAAPQSKIHYFNSLSGESNLKDELKPILKEVADVFSVTPNSMAHRDVGNFYPFNINLFIENMTLPCDIYAFTNGTEEKKLLNKNQTFHPEVLSLLSNLTIKVVYTQAQDRLKLMSVINESFSSVFKDKNSNLEKKSELLAKTQEYIFTTCKEFGIDEVTMELANNSIENMEEVVKSYPSLDKFVKGLSIAKNAMMANHSLLITYLSNHIVRNTDWGSVEQQRKIAFVAYFHDILIENNKHATINQEKELDSMIPDPKIRERVRSHAALASQIIAKFPKVPMGVDVLIKQHHGVPNGIGFRRQTKSVSPIAHIFIIAEAVAQKMIWDLQKQGDINREKILEEVRAEFTEREFKKIIDTLEKI